MNASFIRSAGRKKHIVHVYNFKRKGKALQRAEGRFQARCSPSVCDVRMRIRPPDIGESSDHINSKDSFPNSVGTTCEQPLPPLFLPFVSSLPLFMHTCAF